MSKKKTILYPVSPPKSNKRTIKIKIDQKNVHTRNFMHFEAQKMFKASVVENKKKKPPKYKDNFYSEDF